VPGILARYARMVAQADKGAVLDRKETGSD
jgi:hypothetical protein